MVSFRDIKTTRRPHLDRTAPMQHQEKVTWGRCERRKRCAGEPDGNQEEIQEIRSERARRCWKMSHTQKSKSGEMPVRPPYPSGIAGECGWEMMDSLLSGGEHGGGYEKV